MIDYGYLKIMTNLDKTMPRTLINCDQNMLISMALSSVQSFHILHRLELQWEPKAKARPFKHYTDAGWIFSRINLLSSFAVVAII